MATPTLRQLNAFLATVEAGSVSAAARLLNVTQPAISQQLRELERMLGLRLLERAGGHTLPSSAGHALLVHARRTRQAVEDLMAAAEARRGGETGRVRLGTGATACIYYLPPVLARMKQRMPGIEVIIAIGNTPEIVRSLEAGELDAAVITLPAPLGRSLTSRELCVDPLVAYLPETMVPGRTTTALRPSQIAALPLILYERGSGTRNIVDAWFRRTGLAPRPIMALGSVEAIKVLVDGGLGATILPELAVQVATPGLAVLPLRPRLARKLGVVLRREKLRDRALRLFLEELERQKVHRSPEYS
jgi:DNA-binding transcriptional LysR family regulator